MSRVRRRQTVAEALEAQRLRERAQSMSLYQKVYDYERKRRGNMQWIKDAIEGLINNQAVRLAFYSLLAAILAYIGDLLGVAKVVP